MIKAPRPDVEFLDATGRVSQAWRTYLNQVAKGINAPENAYPVGSIFITTRVEEPQDLLGFGVWEAFGAGRVLVGVDAADSDFNTIEETGGAKTVTPAGTISQPTFTGTALGTHTHGVGTIAPSVHTGTAVGNHASHTHSFTQSSNVATPDLVAVDTTGTGVAASGTTGNEGATLTHSVTQPDAHTMSGSTAAITAGTPAGTVSAPSFTGSDISIVQKYIAVNFWKRTE